MILYDCYGSYRIDSSTKIIYWYTYTTKSIFDWPRPEDAPSYDAPEEEIRKWCRVGDDWEVVYWEKEPLDSNWLWDFLEEDIWWSIKRLLQKVWFQIRRKLVYKMLNFGLWDEQFIEVPDASLFPDCDTAMVDAVYQELIDAYGREGYYILTTKDKIIEAALQKIYDEWWCFERPRWIEALGCVDTWFLLEHTSAEETIAVLHTQEELYTKFDEKETYYLCEIIKFRSLLEH